MTGTKDLVAAAAGLSVDPRRGAYYRITPSLRVGGAVALGDQQLQNGARKITPEEGQPRVQFETRFKF